MDKNLVIISSSLEGIQMEAPTASHFFLLGIFVPKMVGLARGCTWSDNMLYFC